MKKIRLIFFDYSKSEINGDMKLFFIYFLKLCIEFEKLSQLNIKKQNKVVKKTGRSEILTENQKIRKSENQKIRKSENQKIRKSENQKIRKNKLLKNLKKVKAFILLK